MQLEPLKGSVFQISSYIAECCNGPNPFSLAYGFLLFSLGSISVTGNYVPYINIRIHSYFYDYYLDLYPALLRLRVTYNKRLE